MPLKISNFLIFPKERRSIQKYPKTKKYFRVEFVKDERFADSGTFTILLEDHTLGNLVKM